MGRIMIGSPGRLDMTFVVDWALNNNYLSIIDDWICLLVVIFGASKTTARRLVLCGIPNSTWGGF